MSGGCDEKNDFSRRRSRPLCSPRARPPRPICRADRRLTIPRRWRRPASITGAAPMPVSTSATSGARSPTAPINPSGIAGRRTGRLQLAERPVRVRRRNRPAVFRRRRHLRAVEVLQSVVRHPARPRRLRLQQRPALRHPRPRLRRSEGRVPRARPRPRRKPAGPAASAPKSASRRTGRPRSSISTWISADRTFTITGVDNGLQANMLRFGVNYHF